MTTKHGPCPLSWLLATLIINVAIAASTSAAAASVSAAPASEWSTVASDAGWCWFAEPRALFYQGQHRRTYLGWVSRAGDITVGAYDHDNKQTYTNVVHEQLEADDHNNPSLLVRSDGRILAFYSKHSGRDLFVRLSEKPEDIGAWGPERRLPLNPTKAIGGKGSSYTYPSPVQLADEGGRIYLFWRGENWKPTFATSDDGGDTWSPGRVLIAAQNATDNQRPYMKVASDGKATIHLAFTDGHPRDEARNSVYYLRYRKGHFERANGKQVADLRALPIEPRHSDVVYDGRKSGVRAWVWDLAFEPTTGHPVIAYTRLPGESDHRYHYAAWQEGSWRDQEITAAGGWFPRTPLGQQEREPHYSPGVALDPADPKVVYLSRPIEGAFGRVREIERWWTQDGGANFRSEALTRNSHADNVRPAVVRGASAGGANVFWLHQLGPYAHFTNFRSQLKMNIPAPQPLSGAWQPEAVNEALKRVADWQLANRTSKPDPRGWVQGALYTGLLAWADLAPSAHYRNELRRIADENAWKLGSRPYHADDHVVGQLYLGLHAQDGDPKQIAEVKKHFDWLLEHPSSTTLTFEGYDKSLTPLERWSWCDALFMAPATWAQLYAATGDQRYLDFMTKEWWSSTEFLYDKQEHLFFRDSRFFDKREANGRKVFWSRGNGWVFAGLVRVLDLLPSDHADRPRFERLFREMAGALLGAQQRDGLWRTGLLDPQRWGEPETSGSAFFAYGLAWGLNHKLLDAKRFMPALRRAWPALVAAVREDGRVGWVQPIGDAPRALTKEMTELYGGGAFLLAGVELHKLLTSQHAAATIHVTNPLATLRRHETIELRWQQVAKLARGITAEDLQVIDARTGQALPTQALDLDGNGRPEQLLLQLDLGARQAAMLWLHAKPVVAAASISTTRTHARVVPERKDDFAWENDRVAFRMYGPALERSGEVSSGVDLWSKRGPNLVIDAWYKGDDYHKDHGEGGDFYKVGPSRGCGGTGLLHEGKLDVANNWREAKVLAVGPVRTVFELHYAPWSTPQGEQVQEHKQVSLDYGQMFSRFETNLGRPLPTATRFAAGVVKRPKTQADKDVSAGWLASWEPADAAHGHIGCAIVMPGNGVAFEELDGNMLLTKPAGSSRSFVHWAGGVWDRAGRVGTADAWKTAVENFARQRANPLHVTLSRPQAKAVAKPYQQLAAD